MPTVISVIGGNNLGRSRILEEKEEDLKILPGAGEGGGVDPAGQHSLPQRVQPDLPSLQGLQ